MKACPSCGREYGDALGFCEECGSALVAVAAQERMLTGRRSVVPAPPRTDHTERLAALEQKYGELASRPRAGAAAAALPEDVRARLELVG
ncbi:MAG TPA: hypothetical protein VJB16_01515, partial [archaeon]|nr:hypothetical protein [archaeon]